MRERGECWRDRGESGARRERELGERGKSEREREWREKGKRRVRRERVVQEG